MQDTLYKKSSWKKTCFLYFVRVHIEWKNVCAGFYDSVSGRRQLFVWRWNKLCDIIKNYLTEVQGKCLEF